MTTDTSPEGAQDKALQLAERISDVQCSTREDAIAVAAAADMLCELHARVQELERAVAHAEMAAETEARYADERCAKAAADEREACAQVCVEISMDYWMGDAQFEAATRCCNAIRERGKP